MAGIGRYCYGVDLVKSPEVAMAERAARERPFVSMAQIAGEALRQWGWGPTAPSADVCTADEREVEVTTCR